MKNAGMWVGIFILLFAGVIFYQSFSYDYYSNVGPGPGFFPLWLSGLMIILSLLYIFESVRKDIISFREILPSGKGLWNICSIFASLLVFLLIVPYTGYSIAGVAMLFILFAREYKWYWGLGISVIITVILFFAFDSFLQVPLPVNSFGI